MSDEAPARIHELHYGHGPIARGFCRTSGFDEGEAVVTLSNAQWLVSADQLPAGDATFVLHRGNERIVIRGTVGLRSTAEKDGALRNVVIEGKTVDGAEVTLEVRVDW